MLAKMQDRFLLFVLTLSLGATWGFAGVDFNGDCINDAKPDSRCEYLPLDGGQRIGLYVKDMDNGDPNLNYRLPGVNVYVYAPNVGSDTIVFDVNKEVVATNGQSFVSNADGYVVTSVTGHWTISNAPLGASADVTMQDVKVIKVYNFYVPRFRFCMDPDCKKAFDIDNMQQLPVGDTLPVYVQSVKPIGPHKGEIDDLSPNLWYFLSSKQESLKFLTPGKTPMGTMTIEGTQYYVGQLSNSRSSFLITSDKAISDVEFTLNSAIYYPNVTDTTFRAVEPFKGYLQIVNRNLPTLDSAFIYDTNGDGIGDSIAAYFNGKMTGVDLKDFQYNWPTGGDFINFSGEANKNGNLVELTGVKTTIPNGTPTGDLKVYAVSAVDSGYLSTAIQDRIGPVIQTATLEPGDGDFDYVILNFNKPLDESWTSGSGFLLNGVPLSMTAVEKGVGGDDRIWKFKVPKNSVKVGGEIEIATSCAKDKCPNGLIKAADGNKTGKNNPVKITNSGKNYMDDERNGFYDRNGDGRMDSATVAFKEPITKKDLEEMEVVLYWMDNKGNVLKIKPDLTDTNFVKLSKDGLMLSIVVDSTKFDVQRMLTYVDTAGVKVDSLKYGYAEVIKPVIQPDGSIKKETYPCAMHDRMSPVIAGTFLQPESFQRMEADVLTITFSEPVDRESLSLAALSECFSFKVDGRWVSIPFSSMTWSEDGKSVKLQLENGVPLADRMNPADSLKFDFDKAKIMDLNGNGVSDKSTPVMVKGDPRVLMQSTSLATLDRAVLLADKAAFTEKFVDADDPIGDEMKKSLGILMDISFATVMGEDSSGAESMNLDKVGLSWELKVFTNLGSYVGGASNKLKCSDKDAFDGNCFEHAKKMYVRWNMRSSEGRKVGVGVYVAQFKVNVYGAKNSFKVERIYNWGIRAGKGGIPLDD